MIRKILVFTLLGSSLTLAQQQMEMNMERRAPAGDVSPEKKAPISAEQQKRAMQLLESAEGQARGMKDGGSRAFALLQLARAYKDVDKKKTIGLLEDALSATSTMEDDARFRRTRMRLQEQILNQLIPLEPDKIDDLLGSVDPAGRENVLMSLLRYYNDRKETDKALETIYRIGQEFEMPYGAAATIMGNLTPDQSAEMQQLFTTCLASYRDHEHQGTYFGSGDFGNLVAQYYRQVPAGLAKQAVDVMLDEARKRAQKESESGQPTSISMSSASGAIALNSYYDYRLFQLLPVLRAFDPGEAEKLLKERQDVQTLLEKYPNGMSSVAPEMGKPSGGAGAGRGSGRSGTNFSVSSGGPGGGGGGRPSGPPQGGPSPLEMQKSAKLIEDAADHPQDSIANAATISTPMIRIQTYLGIARESAKKNPSAAKIAVGKAADMIADQSPDEQTMGLREVASMYERLGDTDNAKKIIEKGLSAAEKLLKSDTNADDPNQAPKAYWPSTGAYRSMLGLAAKISPTWAVSLLKEIPDEEIRALNQIAIANALMQTRGGSLEVMQFTKNSGRMMVMNEDTESR